MHQYLIFTAICAVFALVLLRLVLRERLTLQGSISYLAFLGTLGAMGLFPNVTLRLARALGFELISNFLLTTSVLLLALLHLRALVALSRVNILTVRLTQEVAILTERVERAGAVPPAPAPPDTPARPAR